MKKLLVTLLIAVPLGAKYHRATSAQEFEKLVDNYQYSVACFAQGSKQKGEDISSDELKGRQKSFKELQEMLQAAASKHEFKRFLSKDVGFIAVDVGAKRTQNLVEEYNVQQEPVCYAFQAGAQDKTSKKIDPTSTKDILNVLEESAGDDLENILRDRKEEQSEERQERMARYYAYGGYYPYGWGYAWGGSSYWARPYWGWYSAGPCYYW